MLPRIYGTPIVLEFPNTLSPERERQFELRVDDLRIRLLECVEALLREIPSDALRDMLYGVAFQANDALPKRATRPKVENALLVASVYRAHAHDGEALDTLLEFTVAVTEYYDIADDLFDGDVVAERTGETFLAMHLLVPLFVRRLGWLGADAACYWADHATTLIEAPYVEHRSDPTFDAYVRSLERQGELFGFATGLAATVAGVDRDCVERARRLGNAYYAYEQLLVDRRQFEQDDGDSWNAWHLASESTVCDALLRHRREATDCLEQYPREQRQAVSSLFAHDLDEIRDSAE